MILGAPKQSSKHSNELAVVGVHAMLFDDDSTASFVDSPHALVPWVGDDQVLMDRYDVRHLLEDVNALKPRGTPGKADVSEEELNEERYKDLLELEQENVPQPSPPPPPPPASTSGVANYNNVSFNYGSVEDQKDAPPVAEEPFVASFAIPEHLQSHLPTTQKVHQIISGTAKFVSKHGGQAEIVLRVKQADNPTFGFLMPGHILHPYFRYLVDNPAFTGALEKPSRVLTSSKPSEGLRLLGEAYGDEDEEAEGQAAKLSTVKARDPPGLAPYKEPDQQLKVVISKMVEFISRNGKEFEDVVKERDKAEGKFEFLLPWSKYYPYYLKMLQHANQERRAERSKKKPGSSNERRKARITTASPASEAARPRSRFDVTPTMMNPGDSNDEASDSDDSGTRDTKEEEGSSYNEQKQECSMSYDEVMAAIMAATRGVKPSKVLGSTGSGKGGVSKAEGSVRDKEDKRAERLKKAKILAEGVKEQELGTGGNAGASRKDRQQYESDTSEDKTGSKRRKRDNSNIEDQGRRRRRSHNHEHDEVRRRRRRKRESSSSDDERKRRRKYSHSTDTEEESTRHRRRKHRGGDEGRERRNYDVRDEWKRKGREAELERSGRVKEAPEIPDDLRAKVRAMLAEI